MGWAGLSWVVHKVSAGLSSLRGPLQLSRQLSLLGLAGVGHSLFALLYMVSLAPVGQPSLLLRQGWGSRRDSRVSEGFLRLQSGTPIGPSQPQPGPLPRAHGTDCTLLWEGLRSHTPNSAITAPSEAMFANCLPLGLTLCHCHTGCQPVLLPGGTDK